MFGRGEKRIFVKKDIVPAHKINPLARRKTFRETRFDRFDIPGETGKSARKILLIILALFAFWFVYECASNWNIFD
ncbi:MAG: hypothetical protein J6P03_01165 [Opitutales bacterium]|nr:hypothetical protein [Opitutales bacterium]